MQTESWIVFKTPHEMAWGHMKNSHNALLHKKKKNNNIKIETQKFALWYFFICLKCSYLNANMWLQFKVPHHCNVWNNCNAYLWQQFTIISRWCSLHFLANQTLTFPKCPYSYVRCFLLPLSPSSTGPFWLFKMLHLTQNQRVKNLLSQSRHLDASMKALLLAIG